MARCEDCIHYDVCGMWSKDSGLARINANGCCYFGRAADVALRAEWISVEERLPHSQQMVIGYTPCDGYMFVGFYQKVDSPYYKSYWNIITAMRSTRKVTKKVTHWMPIPEPPKESKR